MKHLLASGFAAAYLATSIGAAFAQPEERLRQGVLDRDRPAYAAKGMRAGAFLLYPALDISTIYDDNIFATKDNAKSDFIVQTHPSLKVESNLPRHAFYFRGDLLNGTYLDHSSEDRTDFYVGGGARIDVKRTVNWNTDFYYQKDTEDRGSPDSDGAAKDPVDFYHFVADSSLRYRPGRLNFTAGGIFENYRFSNVPLITPELGVQFFQDGSSATILRTFQNNRDRDRDIYAGYGRIGYDVSPGYELFMLGLFSITNYDQHLDDNGFNRDSSGYQLEGGARFEITNVISGEASVGYLERGYQDPRLRGVSGISTEVKVNWYVTRLTTLNFSASRRIQETTLFDAFGTERIPASGYLDAVFQAGVDHELLRNLILSANFRYDIRDYVGIDRTDHIYGPMLRALYLINRNFSIAGEYHYYNRDSDVASEDYSRNQFMLTLRAQI